VTGTKS